MSLAPAVTRVDPDAVLADAHRLLDLAGPAAEWGVSPDPGRTVVEVDRLSARLAALRLELVCRADRERVADEAGAADTAAWLASRTRTDPRVAAGQVRLARAVVERLPAVADALATGRISTEHAAVIAAADAALPDRLDEAARTRVEAGLVAQARWLEPRRLRRHARRALLLAGRPVPEVDAHEDAALRAEEDAAHSRCRLTLHDNADGTVTGHFTVPRLAGDILRRVVQQLASPRRRQRQEQGALDGRVGALGMRAEAAEPGGPVGALGMRPDGARRPEAHPGEAGTTATSSGLDWAHRYGAAFAEVLEHLPTDRLSGKVAATVVVTIPEHRLHDMVGAAHLDTGHDLSAAEARRLACNAGLLPAVLGHESIPLDLGRASRFFTEAQRVALATVYDSCAVVDCDRPYAWCELHHHDPWRSGGGTRLDNAIPLCGHHHRLVDHPSFRHTVSRRDGRAEVTIHRRT